MELLTIAQAATKQEISSRTLTILTPFRTL